MFPRTVSILRTVACVMDILFALVLSILVLLFVLPWEGGPQAAPGMLAIVWGYAIPNLGALISKSRLWRIVWSLPAVLGNLGALWVAGRLFSDLADPISAAVCKFLLMLVLLNAPVMFLRPLPPGKGGYPPPQLTQPAVARDNDPVSGRSD